MMILNGVCSRKKVRKRAIENASHLEEGNNTTIKRKQASTRCRKGEIVSFRKENGT